LAQQPAAPTQAEGTEQKTATVSGIVVNQQSGEPLRRADVTLMPVQGGRTAAGPRAGGPEGPAGTRRAATDQTGKFSISGVEPGRYQLSAQRQGYLQGRYGARKPRQMGTQIEIAAGLELKDLKIELTPQGVITGRVLDEEGEPLQSIQVQVMSQGYGAAMGMGRGAGRGARRFMPQGGSATNDKGEFRITNVAPGEVILEVRPMRFNPMQQTLPGESGEMGYVATYYPGVTDAARAQKIPVAAGAELSGFDIRLQKTRVYRIKGKVIDGVTGAPVKNFMAMTIPRDSPAFFGPMGGGFQRQPDGSFELRNVTPGSYTLNVRGEGRNGINHRERIDVSDNVEGLVIRVMPGVDIAGQVIAKDPSKLTVSSVRVQVTDADTGMGFFGGGSTKDDGTFTVESVGTGRYRINAFLQDGYIESIKVGEQETLGKDFEIAGGTAPPVKVYVSHESGTVTASAMNNDQPATTGSVVLLPRDKDLRVQPFVKVSPVDQSGSCTLRGLAPGEYIAFAMEELEYGFWDDDEIMKKIESKGVKVSVEKNGTHALQLKLTELPTP